AEGVDRVERDPERAPLVGPAAPVDDASHAGLAVEPALLRRAPEAHDELLAGQDRELRLEEHALGGQVDDAGADELEVARAHDFAGRLHATAQARARTMGMKNGTHGGIVVVRCPGRPRNSLFWRSRI